MREKIWKSTMTLTCGLEGNLLKKLLFRFKKYLLNEKMCEKLRNVEIIVYWTVLVFLSCFTGTKKILRCPIYRGSSTKILVDSRNLEFF